MRKFVALAVAVFGVVFLLASGTASAGSIVDLLTFQSAVDAAQAVDPTLAAPANDGSHDFAVGGFERANVAMSHTGFSAQSGPQGQAPTGHLSSTSSTGLKERYDVTCLAVFGPDAAIGLVPTNSPPTNAGTERVLAVHDGDLPGGGGDLYTFWFTSASNCQFYVGLAFFAPLSGNIVVHDADLP
jgi:hypothetical protein